MGSPGFLRYSRNILCVMQLGHCNYVELIDTIFTDVEGVD